MMASWAGDYVGIPYQANGRGREGLDCIGLLYLIYDKELGLHPPDYAYDHDDASTIEQRYFENRNRWQRKTIPEVGDLVMLTIAGMTTHLGVYIGAGKFIHSMQGCDSVIDKIDSLRWRNRIAGFYAWRK